MTSPDSGAPRDAYSRPADRQFSAGMFRRLERRPVQSGAQRPYENRVDALLLTLVEEFLQNRGKSGGQSPTNLRPVRGQSAASPGPAI